MVTMGYGWGGGGGLVSYFFGRCLEWEGCLCQGGKNNIKDGVWGG